MWIIVDDGVYDVTGIIPFSPLPSPLLLFPPIPLPSLPFRLLVSSPALQSPILAIGLWGSRNRREAG